MTNSHSRLVTRDAEFNWVTSQINAHQQLRDSTFRLYIQTFSAITGGSIWLSIQPRTCVEAPIEKIKFAKLTDNAAVLLALVSVVMIFASYWGWRSYRKSHSKMVPHVPPPQLLASITWAAMVLTVLGSTYLFWQFNPFGMVNPVAFLVGRSD